MTKHMTENSEVERDLRKMKRARSRLIILADIRPSFPATSSLQCDSRAFSSRSSSCRSTGSSRCPQG